MHFRQIFAFLARSASYLHAKFRGSKRTAEKRDNFQKKWLKRFTENVAAKDLIHTIVCGGVCVIPNSALIPETESVFQHILSPSLPETKITTPLRQQLVQTCNQFGSSDFNFDTLEYTQARTPESLQFIFPENSNVVCFLCNEVAPPGQIVHYKLDEFICCGCHAVMEIVRSFNTPIE